MIGLELGWFNLRAMGFLIHHMRSLVRQVLEAASSFFTVFASRKEARYAGLIESVPDIPDASAYSGDEFLSHVAASPQFEKCNRFFADTAPWNEGLVHAAALALLYYAARATKPAIAVEIGTSRGWTAQVLAYAAAANDRGVVHTVGPYDAWRFLPRFARWPRRLRRHLKFHAVNSAEFFQNRLAKTDRIGLAFIDGNHDYEFSLFDIQCAARAITPLGLIFVDDVDQAGPLRAVDDFLANNPAWRRWIGGPAAGFGILQAPA